MVKRLMKLGMVMGLFSLIVSTFFTSSAQAREPFPDGIGVNTHFYGADPDIDRIADAGLTMIRTDLYWSDIETTLGVYDFQQRGHDALVNKLDENEITPYFVLAYSNDLYPSLTTAAGRQAYLNYVDAATKRYKGKGAVWEIWNEPNQNYWPSGNVVPYAQLLKEASAIIKANDPSGYVVGPAVAGTSPESFAYLTALFEEDILDYLDAVSIHPYRAWEPESAWYEYDVLRNLIPEYTDKDIKIINGEWGYSTATDWWGLNLTEEEQASYAVRMFLTDKSHDVPISIWYDWKDDGSDPNNPEHNFGIIDESGTAKPAYQALSTFGNVLKGYKYQERILVDSWDDYILLFTNNQGEEIYVFWTVQDEHTVNLPPNNIKGYGTNMYGDYDGEGYFDGDTTLHLTQNPVYLIAE